MSDFTNKIICGNCIDVLKGQKPFADLVFADPPFNIGYKYDRYHDRKKKEHYLDWSREWINACLSILKEDGSFYIAIGDDYAAHIRIICEELGLHLRNWIIWHYTFGQQTKSKFARSHTHIFYFVKNKDKFTFNDWAVRVPSDRQLIYNDKRANSKGKMPDDTWNQYSRVCGTFKERQGWHPCQMPESLLSRIIAVSSNEGDLVFDPFIGSGTTAAAALQMDRKYCGTDISESYVENCRARLESLACEAKSKDENGLSKREVLEIRRLFIDMDFSLERIVANPKILDIFTRQVHIRMNNDKKYSPETIAKVLGSFEDRAKKE